MRSIGKMSVDQSMTGLLSCAIVVMCTGSGGREGLLGKLFFLIVSAKNADSQDLVEHFSALVLQCQSMLVLEHTQLHPGRNILLVSSSILQPDPAPDASKLLLLLGMQQYRLLALSRLSLLILLLILDVY